LVMPANRRIHSSQSWYKSGEAPVIRLFARNLDKPSFQESQVRFNPLATQEFDPSFDGRFLAGYAPVFYSRARDEHLMVNSLPGFSQETVIPFDFVPNDGNRFQIEAEIAGSLQAMVMLFDKKTGIEHNLTLDSVYTFSASPEDRPDRFLVTFSHEGQVEHPGEQIVVFPCDKNLCVKMNGRVRMEVNSLTGQPVFCTEFISDGTYRTEARFNSGYYVVKLTTESGVVVRKVFINS